MAKQIKNLEGVMGLEYATLRRIAAVTGASYQMILKASKQPKAGEIYDPEAVNLEAIEGVIKRKIGEEEFAAINWESFACELKEADESGVVAVKLEDIAVGDTVVFKKEDALVYTVVAMTDTHIALQLNDTSKLRSMTNATFKTQGGHKA